MWGTPSTMGIIMLYPGCPHIFRCLEYSGASIRGHTYFPVVQCIGLQYSVSAEMVKMKEKYHIIADFKPFLKYFQKERLTFTSYVCVAFSSFQVEKLP